MIYPHNFEQKTGFDTIRSLLAAHCLSSMGEELTLQMAFSSRLETVKVQLAQTEEMMRLLQEEDNFPLSYCIDLRQALKNISLPGTWLEQSLVFDLRRSLKTINETVKFLKRKPDGQTGYPHLAELAKDIVLFPQLVSQIDKIMDKAGLIKDSASPALFDIRRQMARIAASISQRMNTILRQAQAEGYVEKDIAPSLRNGRLVIPVAPAYKRKINGIVHDESASGKTVYIEPAEIVEANNRIRELEAEEKREIVKILTLLCDGIRPHIDPIVASYDFLAIIDFIRAKALFSASIHAICPHVEDRPFMQWQQAVHPLLFLAHSRQGKKVQPLDIALEGENRILVISGPNAGGKSVCLKTAGLLQYMLQCGLPVPLAETSVMGIFESIFIDIGDEQSIENDLSTYSSHLSNMKYCLEHCNCRSLLLIDEFGAGTEPHIGGAIAEALLKRFVDKKARAIITTHYPNLKQFAETCPGVLNGAMLYDQQKMSPLFILSIGNAGSSFALNIAQNTGLPADLIADAEEIAGKNYIDMDKYLQDIARDKRHWEQMRRQIDMQQERLQQLAEQYTLQRQEFETQRKQLLLQAKSEALGIINRANSQIENTVRAIREAEADKEKTKILRQQVANYKQQLQTEISDHNKSQPPAARSKKNKNRQQKSQTPETEIHLLQPGDAVRLKGQKNAGKVLEIKGMNATVAFGNIKSVIGVDNLEYVNPASLKNNLLATPSSVSKQTMDKIYETRLNFRQDIDLRGMYGEEALQALVYFIDDAIEVGASRVRILHGTGNGILRQIVRQYLAGVSGVARYHDEHVQFGGAGITVVDFE